jgi:hypothetical protein
MRGAVPLGAAVMVLSCVALGFWAVRREAVENAAAVAKSREAVVSVVVEPVRSTAALPASRSDTVSPTSVPPLSNVTAHGTTAPSGTNGTAPPATVSNTTAAGSGVVPRETYALFLMHQNDRYFECVLISACKLRRLDPDRDVTVLVMREVSGLERRKLGVCATSVVEVALIEPANVHYPMAHYRNTYTKLFIFDMLAFRRVIFVDADLVVVQSLASAVVECGEFELCASPDFMMSHNYFNAGLLIVRPSRKRFEELLVQMQKKPNRSYPEQDLLNEVFANRWGRLDAKYNQLHYNDPHGWNRQHGIQEKPWVYRHTMPGLYKMWESDKSYAYGLLSKAGL